MASLLRQLLELRMIKNERGIVEFQHTPFRDTRVLGLMLWGTDSESIISNFQIGNCCMVIEPVHAFVFQTNDIVTFDEANQLLERRDLKLLRRQEMEEFAQCNHNIRLQILGKCTGAALLVQFMAFEDAKQRVEIHPEGSQFRARVYTQKIMGEECTWDVVTQSEGAAVILTKAIIEKDKPIYNVKEPHAGAPTGIS